MSRSLFCVWISRIGTLVVCRIGYREQSGTEAETKVMFDRADTLKASSEGSVNTLDYDFPSLERTSPFQNAPLSRASVTKVVVSATTNNRAGRSIRSPRRRERGALAEFASQTPWRSRG